MYPNNVASQEPLARTLQMRAAKKQQRRTGFGQGMSETVQPMDSLDVQSSMDSMQDVDVSAPTIGSSPFRMASMVTPAGGDRASASPASGIMLASQRTAGGFVPQSPRQCAPGTACHARQQAAASGMTDYGFGLAPGERVIAIDGVPVNGAAPMMATPQMSVAAPSTPAAAPIGQPAVVDSADRETNATAEQPMAGMTPDQMYAKGVEHFNNAAAAWATPGMQGVVDTANQTILGRMWTSTAMQALLREPELELLRRQQDVAEEADKTSRAVVEQNMRTAREHSAEGFVYTLDAMTAGIGPYAGQDAQAREEGALAYVARFRQLAGMPVTAEDLDPETGTVGKRVRGMIAAHEIGRLIAENGSVEGGRWKWQQGNLEAVDRTLARYYFGKTDDAKQPLLGEALRERMHKDLDLVLARHVEYRILKASPKMDPVDAARLARAESFKAIDNMYGMVNGYQLRHAQGDYGVINTRQGVDRIIDIDNASPFTRGAGPIEE